MEQQNAPKRHNKIWMQVCIAVLCLAVGISIGILAFSGRSGQISQVEPTASPSATAAPNNGQSTTPSTGSSNLADVIDSVMPSVVSITTTQYAQRAGTEVASGYGSGFVYSADGLIATNNHVVEGTDNVSVKLHDGSTYPAEVVGGDSLSDVALLKIEAEGLSHVAVGDSDAIAVGEGCIAIGNPLGELTFTMTGGYVSALPREINISGKPISMFQTDAAINAGNSGGPLFDMAGNVIGITSAKISGITGSGASIEGVGFAIPINEALRVVYDLQEYGYVRGRAFLGVTVKELDAATADTYGLPVGPIVQSVVADSCADKAGIAVKDIILAFNGRNVKTYTQLMSALNKCSAGDEVTLRIYRAGAELDVTLTLDERPEEQTVRNVEQGDVDNTEEYSYYYDPDKGE